MPAFSKIGGILANELSVDEAARKSSETFNLTETTIRQKMDSCHLSVDKFVFFPNVLLANTKIFVYTLCCLQCMLL